MKAQKTRLATTGVLVLLLGLFLVPAAHGRILKQGITYCNYNFSPVTLTYSWSGNYPGQGEVCLLPATVTIPPGQCVKLTPPAGFNPTDFVILSSVENGQDSGGGTIYDPPTRTTVARIQVPCAASGSQVWFFQYFGEKDFGPIFTNAPAAMDGLQADGSPNVAAAERNAKGGPVLNTSQGHCFVATTDPVIDVATGKVRSEYTAKTDGKICSELIFGDSAATAATSGTTAQK